MMPHYQEAVEHADQFAERNGLTYARELGAGYDGIVFATDVPSAVKAFRHEALYQNELAVYRRLEEHAVRAVKGFKVPRLLRSDDELWTLEIEWVTPPFVLDFAGARLDEPPPYANDPEVMGPWLAEKREQFGDRWPTVSGVLASFRRLGIYLSDVKPGNIEFPYDDP